MTRGRALALRRFGRAAAIPGDCAKVPCIAWRGASSLFGPGARGAANSNRADRPPRRSARDRRFTVATPRPAAAPPPPAVFNKSRASVVRTAARFFASAMTPTQQRGAAVFTHRPLGPSVGAPSKAPRFHCAPSSERIRRKQRVAITGSSSSSSLDPLLPPSGRKATKPPMYRSDIDPSFIKLDEICVQTTSRASRSLRPRAGQTHVVVSPRMAGEGR